MIRRELGLRFCRCCFFFDDRLLRRCVSFLLLLVAEEAEVEGVEVEGVVSDYHARP